MMNSLPLWIPILGTLLGAMGQYTNEGSDRCFSCSYYMIGFMAWYRPPGEGVCSLLTYRDFRAADKQPCPSGLCYIRTERDGSLVRGCADLNNLPAGISPLRSCQFNQLTGTYMWFCEGDLCNTGSMGNGLDRCGEESRPLPRMIQAFYKHMNLLQPAPQSENTYLPSSDNTYLPSSEETYPPSSDNTYLPSSENTYLPSSENTYIPSSENTYIPSSENTYASQIPSHNQITDSFNSIPSSANSGNSGTLMTSGKVGGQSSSSNIAGRVTKALRRPFRPRPPTHYGTPVLKEDQRNMRRQNFEATEVLGPSQDPEVSHSAPGNEVPGNYVPQLNGGSYKMSDNDNMMMEIFLNFDGVDEATDGQHMESEPQVVSIQLPGDGDSRILPAPIFINELQQAIPMPLNEMDILFDDEEENEEDSQSSIQDIDTTQQEYYEDNLYKDEEDHYYNEDEQNGEQSYYNDGLSDYATDTSDLRYDNIKAKILSLNGAAGGGDANDLSNQLPQTSSVNEIEDKLAYQNNKRKAQRIAEQLHLVQTEISNRKITKEVPVESQVAGAGGDDQVIPVTIENDGNDDDGNDQVFTIEILPMPLDDMMSEVELKTDDLEPDIAIASEKNDHILVTDVMDENENSVLNGNDKVVKTINGDFADNGDDEMAEFMKNMEISVKRMDGDSEIKPGEDINIEFIIEMPDEGGHDEDGYYEEADADNEEFHYEPGYTYEDDDDEPTNNMNGATNNMNGAAKQSTLMEDMLASFSMTDGKTMENIEPKPEPVNIVQLAQTEVELPSKENLVGIKPSMSQIPSMITTKDDNKKDLRKDELSPNAIPSNVIHNGPSPMLQMLPMKVNNQQAKDAQTSHISGDNGAIDYPDTPTPRKANTAEEVSEADKLMKEQNSPPSTDSAIPVSDESAGGGAITKSKNHASVATNEVDIFPKDHPCDGLCLNNPSRLYPAPGRAQYFIQCGSGYGCNCCVPYYMRCPTGTLFDSRTRVCSATGAMEQGSGH